MIVEYRVDPYQVWDVETQEFGPNEWRSVQSVDLRYVSSARRGSDDVTFVTLVGASAPIPINVEYDRFVRDWRSVKR